MDLNLRDDFHRALLRSVGLFRQDNMGSFVRGDVLRALVAEAHRVDAGEEVLAPAEEHGGDREVDFVDQPRAEVLANGGNPAAEADILALSRLRRAFQRGMDGIRQDVESRSAVHRGVLARMWRSGACGTV